MAGAHPTSLVEPGVDYQSVTAEISAVPLRAPGRGWLLGLRRDPARGRSPS